MRKTVRSGLVYRQVSELALIIAFALAILLLFLLASSSPPLFFLSSASRNYTFPRTRKLEPVQVRARALHSPSYIIEEIIRVTTAYLL